MKGVVFNDPDQGKPFRCLDQKTLDANGATQEDVARFVEAKFAKYVYRVITKNELFTDY